MYLVPSFFSSVDSSIIFKSACQTQNQLRKYILCQN